MKFGSKVAQASEAIAGANAMLITAGAGMGVDSGLPDFRGSEGFWRAYPAIASLGLSFEEIANPSWFEKSPELAWAFYGHRLELYRKTKPHPGFSKLLELAGRMPMGYFVFTSNVDGQFQKAGFATERIVECHGSIHHFQCACSCGGEIWDACHENVVVDETVFRAQEPLPMCKYCRGIARPNILMFWDSAWIESRTESQQVLLDNWLARLCDARARLLVIELGAGLAVPTVRRASERATDQTGGRLVRINLRDDTVPNGQIGIKLGAAEGIRRIYESLARPKEKT